jgi:tetratricopeptide (TPR) repeat protein
MSETPVSVHFDEAVRLFRAGEPRAAEDACRRILAADPKHAESLHLLAILALSAARPGQAMERAQDALKAKPGFAEAYNTLGLALAKLGRDEAAAAAYRRASALKPDSAEIHSNLGNALRSLGRYEEALGACLRAADLKPNLAEAYINQGLTLQAQGRTDEALIATDRALAIDPASSLAWQLKGELKTFKPGDLDFQAMDAALANAKARGASLDQVRLEFALGQAWMDVADGDRAFAHLNAGNRLMRGAYDYDIDAEVGVFEAAARAFSPDVMARLSGAGDPSDMPVFIVGMPRSGTTLIEQILASHPRVHGAGELKLLAETLSAAASRREIGPAYPQMAQTLTPTSLATLGRAYVHELSSLAPGKARVTDKLPGNFRLAGLIHLMLPNARIIHCRRDSIDTCLSCYSRHFASGHLFANDLRELGLYHRAYERLMAHWRVVLPADRFVEVAYEDVVDDLEGEARRLVGFCGLDWDAACLKFHERHRPLRTSISEVRQPIYRSSVARWKPYERQLAPLIRALDRT